MYSAGNMVGAVTIPRFEHLLCSAHLLQPSINKALAASILEKPLALVWKIVGHFRHSPPQMAVLRAKNPSNLILVSYVYFYLIRSCLFINSTLA